jgi:hypothetical protein
MAPRISIPGHNILTEVTSQALLLAIKHQNIIGLDLFRKGFISQYWSHAYYDLNHTSVVHESNNWDVKLVECAIGLYKGIWEE